MTFDNEKTVGQGDPKPASSNPLTQRLNLARHLASQIDQNPGLATPKQDLSLSGEIIDSLKNVVDEGNYSTDSVLSALDQVAQRFSNHLDRLEARLKAAELKRNLRRN